MEFRFEPIDDVALLQVAYYSALFRKLGTPTVETITSLPDFPQNPPQLLKGEWGAKVVAKAGIEGINVLTALLSWDPPSRLRAESVVSSPFAKPNKFELFEVGPPDRRVTKFLGHRTSWNLLGGNLAPEILQWIREDPALIPGTAEHSNLNIAFHGGGSNWKTEDRGAPVCDPTRGNMSLFFFLSLFLQRRVGRSGCSPRSRKAESGFGLEPWPHALLTQCAH